MSNPGPPRRRPPRRRPPRTGPLRRRPSLARPPAAPAAPAAGRAPRPGSPGTPGSITTHRSGSPSRRWPAGFATTGGGRWWSPTTTRWWTGPRLTGPAWDGTAATPRSCCPAPAPGSSSGRWSPTPRCRRPPSRYRTDAAPAAAAPRPARPAPSTSQGCSTHGAAWRGWSRRRGSSPRSIGSPWGTGSTVATTARRCARSTASAPGAGRRRRPSPAPSRAPMPSRCWRRATRRCSRIGGGGTSPNATRCTCGATRCWCWPTPATPGRRRCRPRWRTGCATRIRSSGRMRRGPPGGSAPPTSWTSWPTTSRRWCGPRPTRTIRSR